MDCETSTTLRSSSGTVDVGSVSSAMTMGKPSKDVPMVLTTSHPSDSAARASRPATVSSYVNPVNDSIGSGNTRPPHRTSRVAGSVHTGVADDGGGPTTTSAQRRTRTGSTLTHDCIRAS